MLITLITVLDSCSTVARQRLYLIILFVPTCLCNGLQHWVQHRKECVLYVKLRSAKVHPWECVSEIQLSRNLRSVLTRVLKRRRACSRFFGPQGRSLFIILDMESDGTTGKPCTTEGVSSIVKCFCTGGLCGITRSTGTKDAAKLVRSEVVPHNDGLAQ